MLKAPEEEKVGSNYKVSVYVQRAKLKTTGYDCIYGLHLASK